MFSISPRQHVKTKSRGFGYNMTYKRFSSRCPKMYLPRWFSLTVRRRRTLCATHVHRLWACWTHGCKRRRCRRDTVPGGVPAMRGREWMDFETASVDRRVSDGTGTTTISAAASAVWSGTVTSGTCDNGLGRTPLHKAMVLAAVEATDHKTNTEILIMSIVLASLIHGFFWSVDDPWTCLDAIEDRWYLGHDWSINIW